MYYDLHIHSCLSPCAENEMTPNNICNMAVIKGLNLIAVTDHNSTRQVPALKEVSDRVGIRMIYGTELQTVEEVHILALFQTAEQAVRFQEWIDSHMPNQPNKPEFFGEQLIKNSADETIGIEERLLLVSLDATIEVCCKAIKDYGGATVAAHALGRENGIIQQLGFIPENLKLDGIEIASEKDKAFILKLHPGINESDLVWLCDSDAHRLIDIHEAEYEIEESQLNRLWGDK